MNRLKSQRLKRQRRHADHEARRVNNAVGTKLTINDDGIAEEDVNIFVTRATNARWRKRMRKRQLLAPNVATTTAEAYGKLPVAWKKVCRVHLEPGKYGVEP